MGQAVWPALDFHHGPPGAILVFWESLAELKELTMREFEAAEVTIHASGDNRTKHVEGKIEKIAYDCPGKSALQVRRNTEQALRAAGFAIDFTGYDLPVHYVTGHKGGLWLAIEASELTASSQYQFTSVVTEEMSQEMTADAKAWTEEGRARNRRVELVKQ